MDRWALRSHELAIKATDEGRLPEEIVAVRIESKKGETVVEVDEAPRRDTSLEKLAALKPAFRKGGTVTAANASSLNDGAAALLLMSESQAQATTDPLTGLLNRRTLENKVRSIQASGILYSVVMADLDRFKLVNDTHGHQAGDRAPRQQAASPRRRALRRAHSARAPVTSRCM